MRSAFNKATQQESFHAPSVMTRGSELTPQFTQNTGHHVWGCPLGEIIM